jgi:hypothetical protein
MLESINRRFVQDLLKVARRDICGSALVTAPNQAVLDLIVPDLQDCFGRETILVVKDDKEAQLRKHRERVDSGLTSILVLLQEDTEGLHFPREYCRTVLVTHPENLNKHRPVAIFEYSHLRPRLRFEDFARFATPIRPNQVSLNGNRADA